MVVDQIDIVTICSGESLSKAYCGICWMLNCWLCCCRTSVFGMAGGAGKTGAVMDTVSSAVDCDTLNL